MFTRVNGYRQVFYNLRTGRYRPDNRGPVRCRRMLPASRLYDLFFSFNAIWYYHPFSIP